MAFFEAEDIRAPGFGPVSFTLQAGECLGVSGPSGGGKSRLMRILADLEPHEGAVRLEGVSAEHCRPQEWRARVGYVPSESSWWGERVADSLSHAGDFAPTRLGLPEAIRERAVEHLSSGEKQRLALLRQLALSPGVLLLDEPSAHLDQAATACVEALVMDWLDAGHRAVVWVSHDPDQLSRVCVRRLIIDEGRGAAS